MASRVTAGILVIWSHAGTIEAHQPDSIFQPQPGYESRYIALQRWIVTMYGGVNARGLPTGVDHGYVVPTHSGAVVTGGGFGLSNPLAIEEFTRTGYPWTGSLARPPLLLFAPAGEPGPIPGGGVGTFADAWLDPPYRLIGWAYGGHYDPARRPHLDGIPDEAWIVHEAGWHMSDGSMILTPPREECPGQIAQGAPTGPPPWHIDDDGALVFGVFAHGRAWDIHFWRHPDRSQVPVISLTEPFDQLPPGTLDLPPGTFFYPDCPPR